MNWNQAGYSRAGDRLARTSGLFGFGSGIMDTASKESAGWLNMLSGISGEQQNLADAGLAAAGPATPSGGSTTGQTAGAFLANLGGGMMTGNVDYSSLFGGRLSGGDAQSFRNQMVGFGNQAVPSAPVFGFDPYDSYGNYGN
jgi:hypothetical protein